MAQNDSAVLRPGTGYVLLDDVGATKPSLSALTTFAGGGALPSGFTELGHTSADDIIAFDQDGGTTQVLGSWQNPAILEVQTEVPVDFFVIPALEFTNDVLSLYYGGGNVATANEFALPDTPAPTEKAVCVVFKSGTTVVGFYVPKASILRDDSPQFATDALASFPLRFTLLKASGSPKGIWIADQLGAA